MAHLGEGDSIIMTSSVQAYNPSEQVIDYAATKAAELNMGSPWPRNSAPAASG